MPGPGRTPAAGRLVIPPCSAAVERHDRRPQETLLFRLVKEHLPEFLARTRESYEKPLPRYVVREFEEYLRCGDFERGFSRWRCDRCRREILVPFSCRTRGLCPSCAARRMSGSAAHLVDRVLPAVPVRQWVLTLPWELRRLAAFRADVLREVVRIFAQVLLTNYRERSRRRGAQGGLLAFVHRGGGSLNLSLHLHILALDGVYTNRFGQVRFHPTSPPSRDEIHQVARRTGERVLRRLRKMGLVRDAPDFEGSNETPELTALDGCAQAALGAGGLEAPGEPMDPPATDSEDARFRCRAPQRWAAGWEHFDVHAGARVGTGDDEGRERLCRYVLRPALSIERLSVLPDGRVAYRVRHALGPGRTHRVMTPLEMLARLAALVPPPRYPLLRYHGVLASGSRWRSSVVPRPPEDVPRPTADGAGRLADGHSPAAPTNKTGAASRPRVPPVEVLLCGGSPAADALLWPPATAAGCLSGWNSPRGEPAIVSPNRLTAAHWARLLDGLLLARSPYIDWPTLRRRTHNVDVLDCPGCGGRLRLLDVVADHAEAQAFLAAAGLLDRDGPRARARDPTA